MQQIKENTDVQQWCYVPTRETAVDGASRGLNADRVHCGSFRFQGPPLLLQNENSWLSVKGIEVEVLRDDSVKSYAAFVHEDIRKISVKVWENEFPVDRG